MTFEEFFIKKKIDLSSLERSDPSLYKEFRGHFALMGEKSFDHSKKFWFNKLRKQFALTEEQVAIAQTKGVDTKAPDLNDNKAIAAAEAPQAAKPAGFKPRFKSASPPKPVDTEGKDPIAEKEEATNARPTSFRPRFNAAKLKTTAASEQTDQNPSEKVVDKDSAKDITDTTNETPNPITTSQKPAGFTPRFKANPTKTVQADPDEVNITNTTPEKPAPEEDQQAPAKPLGFKPRFKAGTTKTEKPQDESQDNKEIQPQDKPTENIGQETPSKALGFKPRFKAGVTKSANTPVDEVEQKPIEDTPDKMKASEGNVPASKPVGFTPRFKKKGD